MDPASVLQKLLSTNEPVARLIYAGLGVIAAAGIAVTWIGKNPNALLLAGFILGFALLATMIVYIVTNPRTRAVLGWTLTLTFCLYLVGLPASALGLWGMPTPNCYLQLLWVSRARCERDSFPTVPLATGAAEKTSAVFRPASTRFQIWLAQDIVTPATPYTAGPIYLQFQNTLPRDQTIFLAQRLTSDGWPIAGADQGGQAVANAPGDNEVRFFDPSARDPAIELANKLNAERPAAPFVVRDFSASGLIAPQGQLEIWLSN